MPPKKYKVLVMGYMKINNCKVIIALSNFTKNWSLEIFSTLFAVRYGLLDNLNLIMLSTIDVKSKNDPKLFGAGNNMNPLRVFPELESLSYCEEMFICKAFPVIQVYTKTGDKSFFFFFIHHNIHICKLR